MLVKNFFGERLELSDEELRHPIGTSERIAVLLEEQFGIPKEHQRVFVVDGQPILSIRSSEQCFDTTEVIIPDEFRDLGASQKDFDYFYNQCHDLEVTKRCLFPFTFRKEELPHAFKDIQKTGLQDIDGYIRDMPVEYKNAILNNLEAYIDSFIDCS